MAFDLKTTGVTAGKALVNWWRAMSIDALCVAVLWLDRTTVAARAARAGVGTRRGTDGVHSRISAESSH